MGKPDHLEEFLRFDADGITVYVSQEMLGRLKPGTRKMRFYIDGYGRFWLNFAEPWLGED